MKDQPVVESADDDHFKRKQLLMLPQREASIVALTFAWVFPTLVTFAYFVWMHDWPAKFQLSTYSVGKTLQFVFPVFYVLLILQQRITLSRSTANGIWLGLGFGILVLLLMLALFYWWLKPQGFLEQPTEKIYDKVAGWGFTAAWQFLLLGLFYSLAHSFLEEYYWRWFVFDHLTRKVSLTNAVVISSIGFMAHHVILLATFFGWTSPMTYLFSIGIAMGGVVWALIYQLSGSLLGPWLSHLLVDAAIFLIGFDLIRERFGW
ncbi:MAG: CPBP family intramembrane glutamic endopeptidase [Pirellulaceae bacterium]